MKDLFRVSRIINTTKKKFMLNVAQQHGQQPLFVEKEYYGLRYGLSYASDSSLETVVRETLKTRI